MRRAMAQFEILFWVDWSDSWQFCAAPRTKCDFDNRLAAVVNNQTIATAHRVYKGIGTIVPVGVLLAVLCEVAVHSITAMLAHFSALFSDARAAVVFSFVSARRSARVKIP